MLPKFTVPVLHYLHQDGQCGVHVINKFRIINNLTNVTVGDCTGLLTVRIHMYSTKPCTMSD